MPEDISSYRGNVSFHVLESGTNNIIAKQYFGEPIITNYVASDGLSIPIIKKQEDSELETFYLLQVQSNCDAGIQPCKDNIPQDFLLLRYDYLCFPLDEEYGEDDDFFFVTTTTTTTTTEAPIEYFDSDGITYEFNITYSESVDLQFKVQNIFTHDYIIYHWEKSIDNGTSWIKVSNNDTGLVDRTQVANISPSYDTFVNINDTTTILYRASIDFPVNATSNNYVLNVTKD